MLSKTEPTHTIPNAAVGPAVHAYSWETISPNEYRVRGRRLAVVRRYPGQWVVWVDGRWVGHVFQGREAAKRFAAGATIFGRAHA